MSATSPTNTTATTKGWQAFTEGRALGLCMVPGIRGTKIPLVKWKQYQTTAPTEEEVAGWRGKFASINPLILTGRSSGVLILDQDGEEAHERLAALGTIPPTVTVQTPRGPMHAHYWFRRPEELGPVHNFVGGYARDLPHIDLRGDGGVAVYPGGRNATGRLYEWGPGRSPRDIEIAPLPPWLYDYIAAHNERLAQAERERAARATESQRARNEGEDRAYRTRLERYADAALRSHLDRIARAAHGERNDQLNRSAYSLAAFLNEGVWSQGSLAQELENAACAAGLDSDPDCGIAGIRATIDSGLRAGRRNRISMSVQPLPPPSKSGRRVIKSFHVHIGGRDG